MKLVIDQMRDDNFTIKLSDSNGVYNLSSDEFLIFCVKKRASDTDALIRKVISDEMITPDQTGYALSLSYSDTNITPGYYYWDLSLKDGNHLYTVIATDDFVVRGSCNRTLITS